MHYCTVLALIHIHEVDWKNSSGEERGGAVEEGCDNSVAVLFTRSEQVQYMWMFRKFSWGNLRSLDMDVLSALVAIFGKNSD